MDAGRSLLSPPPPPPPPTPNLSRTHHLRGSPVSSVSVPMTHDQTSMAVLATTSVVRHFPASFIIQEKPDDYKTHHAIKHENVTQAIMDRWHVESEFLPCEEKEEYEIEHYLKVFERQLLYRPGLSFPLPYSKEQSLLVSFGESIVRATDKVPDSEQAEQGISFPEGPGDVLALAKRAMMASRKAASFAEKSNILATELNESHFLSLDDRVLADDNLIKVRSKKLFKRQSTIRKVPKKPNNVIFEVSSSTGTMRKKIDKSLHSNDPLRLFLWGPETKQLLTVVEEKDLFVQIQELTRLEGIKQRLQMQFDHEPTLPQWAEAAGMSCHVLQSHLHYGKRSREKMIYANFRLVVHVAKQYEGKGLDIQDLLQEGSKGLMKSLGKFKPKVGCRFPTYAYWWIRQSIRKAIFQNSRTIRLPENVFALLKRIKNARRLCIQEGHPPTNEELAKHVGISIEKLESLILTTRHPSSIQDCAWADQGVTVQEITADPKIETPDKIFSKKMIRQHVRNLLGLLPSRERRIIELRFGVHDNVQKSLAEIGAIFGLSRERVRQIETRAMDKLKGFPSQGLGAYIELLI